MTDGRRTAVADSSPLIALAQIDHLWVLDGMFARLVAPDRVFREIERTLPDPPHWLERDRLIESASAFADLGGLDIGERDAIALARQIAAPIVLLDDRPARRRATLLGFTALGTLGILVRAKRSGAIPMVEPFVERLRGVGFFAGDSVVRTILRLAGESPTDQNGHH